jgi:hypothetical protein
VTIQQLTMDLENEPGRLFSVASALSAAGVSIHSLNVVDGDGLSTARMLVDDVKKAREVVLALDIPARLDDVLVLRMSDQVGSLAELLEPVFEEYVNIKYIAAFSEANGNAMAIFRFSDNDTAEKILREHGHMPLTAAELFTEEKAE